VRQPAPATPTIREAGALSGVADGLSNAEIGERLFIAEAAVNRTSYGSSPDSTSATRTQAFCWPASVAAPAPPVRGRRKERGGLGRVARDVAAKAMA
jgi:hypothetical protein